MNQLTHKLHNAWWNWNHIESHSCRPFSRPHSWKSLWAPWVQYYCIWNKNLSLPTVFQDLYLKKIQSFSDSLSCTDLYSKIPAFHSNQDFIFEFPCETNFLLSLYNSNSLSSLSSQKQSSRTAAGVYMHGYSRFEAWAKI